MSPFWIYFFMKIDYIIKTIWCIMRLKGDKWIKKLAVSSMKQNEPVKQNRNTD